MALLRELERIADQIGNYLANATGVGGKQGWHFRRILDNNIQSFFFCPRRKHLRDFLDYRAKVKSIGFNG